MSHGAAGQDSDVGVGLQTGPVHKCDGADGEDRVGLESDDVRAAVVDGRRVFYNDLKKEKEWRQEGGKGGRKEGRKEGRWRDEK